MYQIRTYDEAQEQVVALPPKALACYIDVLKVLKLVPWNGTPYNEENPDGNMRQWVFGPGGYGFVTYLILDDQRLVDVLEVLWLG